MQSIVVILDVLMGESHINIAGILPIVSLKACGVYVGTPPWIQLKMDNQLLTSLKCMKARGGEKVLGLNC